MKIIITLAAFLLLIDKVSHAQTVPEPAAPATENRALLTPYQQASLAVEREKIALERTKALATAAAIIIPILIGVFTVRSQARAQFELKAAELVLTSYSPQAAAMRASLLQSMFGHRLPHDFAKTFDPKNFPGVRLYEMKMALFKSLTEKGADRNAILRQWKELFPDSTWFTDTFPETKTW